MKAIARVGDNFMLKLNFNYDISFGFKLKVHLIIFCEFHKKFI